MKNNIVASIHQRTENKKLPWLRGRTRTVEFHCGYKISTTEPTNAIHDMNFDSKDECVKFLLDEGFEFIPGLHVFVKPKK